MIFRGIFGRHRNNAYSLNIQEIRAARFAIFELRAEPYGHPPCPIFFVLTMI